MTSLYMWNGKRNKGTYLQNIKRFTDLQNKCVTAVGEGIVREFGMDEYTLLHLTQKTNKDVPYSICCNVMLQPGWEGSLGENRYMHMYG